MGKPPVIGLDIGTFAVRAVEVVPAGSRPVLSRFGQVTLPPGAVVGGEVVDPVAVGAALTKLWEEVGFRSRDVAVGAGLTTVIVREGGTPRFVRVLGVGGDDITAAIGNDLGCDAEYAEHLKREAIAAGHGNVATLTRASALVAEHVRPLVEEIRGSLDFYLAQSSVDQVEHLLLTGGGVKTPGLVQGLQGS